MRKRLALLGVGALSLGFCTFSAQAADQGANDVPGPIDNLQDLQDSGKMLFKVADENNDGQISQREAVDAGNLVVGGFFFRADANGDGTLSKEEFRQAQDAFLAQRPILKSIMDRVKQPSPTGESTPNPNVAQGFLAVVDSNGDGQVQSSELRQIVNSAVQSLYASADTNRDGQLNPTEVNAAAVGAVRAIAQTVFDTADADHNGQLSQAEYDKAITVPAHVVFKALDANNDGQISPQEAQTAQRILTSQIKLLQVPEPANSAKNLLKTGAQPEQVAPVPDLKNAPPVQNTQPRTNQ
ncbi:EF-hand domain-containing protein [Singulisphaera sp. PoT]|uniref:EF-hand domain-containing protein n=1 Tax=Singulisphaera sp. PoT TaxID=3411797 RepID=UPI003BF55FF4